MAFLPEPREKMGDAESVSDLYELTGSEDDRLRQAYKVKEHLILLRIEMLITWTFQYFMTRSEQDYVT